MREVVASRALIVTVRPSRCHFRSDVFSRERQTPAPQARCRVRRAHPLSRQITSIGNARTNRMARGPQGFRFGFERRRLYLSAISPLENVLFSRSEKLR